MPGFADAIHHRAEPRRCHDAILPPLPPCLSSSHAIAACRQDASSPSSPSRGQHVCGGGRCVPAHTAYCQCGVCAGTGENGLFVCWRGDGSIVVRGTVVEGVVAGNLQSLHLPTTTVGRGLCGGRCPCVSLHADIAAFTHIAAERLLILYDIDVESRAMALLTSFLPALLLMGSVTSACRRLCLIIAGCLIEGH